MLGRCGVRLLRSPRRWSRAGPQGLQREGGGCGFGSRCGLDNKPPHRPNPRTAFLTLVLDAAFLTPGEHCGAAPWCPPVERAAGRGAGGDWCWQWCGNGLAAQRRPLEGKAHHTCRRPLPPIPGTLALRQRHSPEKALPSRGVATGDREGSEVTSLKIRGGNVTGRVRWAFWQPQHFNIERGFWTLP